MGVSESNVNAKRTSFAEFARNKRFRRDKLNFDLRNPSFLDADMDLGRSTVI